MRKVGVVHLVWAPLGIETFQSFVASYRQHASGLAHHLIIAFNGFISDGGLQEYLALLNGLEYRPLVLPEPVQDIAAYLEAARLSTEDDLCFLNSYSVILHGDWLAKLHAALRQERVGVVGATGSWESMATSMERSENRPRRVWTPRGLRAWVSQKKLLRATRERFDPFPNPHLRTNGFMIARDLLLSFGFGPVCTKDDAHAFESSRHGLTGRIVRAGLQFRVVDCHGRAWPPEQWPESHTFRAGTQENLLVADNRTRDYLEADETGRHLLAQMAWGG